MPRTVRPAAARGAGSRRRVVSSGPAKGPAKARARKAPAALGEAGRRNAISRDDLVAAALELVGPHRSISTLSLREVARQAGIAPNSFYRQFRDMDELAVAVIERAGSSLRGIIAAARRRAAKESSIVRASVATFVSQLRGNDPFLHILLREGTAGSEAFKRALERQIHDFEDELRQDLIRIAAATRTEAYEPAATARAITRLVFAMGSSIMDQPQDRDAEMSAQLVLMIRTILAGAQTLGRIAKRTTAP